MRSLWQAYLMVGLLFFLGACQTLTQTKQLMADPPNVARQKIIPQVPFYPQQEYFCGPTTLSEVANFYGLEQNPATIAPDTFIPGLEGSLQIEMASATRQLGMLAYAERANMRQLLNLLNENIPVIVLQNNSIAWFPQWHYALVIGYDLESAEIILHTGVTEAHRLNFSTFERTWQRGNYWMLAMLPSNKVSKYLDPFIYTKACQDLLDTNQAETGVAALKTAVKQWPEYWLPYFLLGNYYFSTQAELAADWFAAGLPFARQETAYLNNYAMLLSELACNEQAIKLIHDALLIEPHNNNLLDSQTQIKAKQDSDIKDGQSSNKLVCNTV